MSNILQWEPEKSRLWGNAKIANITHLRDDLTLIAGWVKTKAETAALADKADVSKLRQVEELLSSTRQLLEAHKRDTEEVLTAIRKQLDDLDRWARSGEFEKHLQELGDQQMKLMDELATRHADTLNKSLNAAQDARASADAALAECRVIQENVSQIDRQARASFDQALQASQAQLTETSGLVQQVRNDLELSASLKSQCEELTQALRARADELTSAWQNVSQTLSSLSARVEESSTRIAGMAEGAQKAQAQSESVARETQQLHSQFQEEHKQARDRMATLLRESEAQANTAMQNGHLAAAASDLSGAFKADCEKLAEGLRAKGDELSVSWERARQEMSAFLMAGEHHASQAEASAEASQAALAALSDRIAALEAAFGKEGASGAQAVPGQGPAVELATRVAALEQKLQALTMSMEQEISRQVHGAAEDLTHDWNAHVALMETNNESFWGRLKWLLVGRKEK